MFSFLSETYAYHDIQKRSIYWTDSLGNYNPLSQLITDIYSCKTVHDMLFMKANERVAVIQFCRDNGMKNMGEVSLSFNYCLRFVCDLVTQW